METKLSIHLGYEDKTGIHEYLKQHIGQKIDEHGKSVYESISDVVDCDHMMQRIYEFQQYVAIAFDYTFEPFNNEEHGELPKLDGMGFGAEAQPGD